MSKWMKIFDQQAGWYRFMHKGSGVIRDSLPNLGTSWEKPAPPRFRKVLRGGKRNPKQRKGGEKNPSTVGEGKGAAKRRSHVETHPNFGKSALNFFHCIMAWFRSPQYLEKTDVARIIIDTPLQPPANGQHQEKTGLKFSALNRNVTYGWYNAYFNVEYRLGPTLQNRYLLGPTLQTTRKRRQSTALSR